MTASLRMAGAGPERAGMTAAEFEARITAWARGRADVAALVLGGSRAAVGGTADVRSDWDLHVVTRTPRAYHGTGWLADIAPCWCAHAGVTPRGVVKVSAVFAGGWEADFIPLAAWQMRLVYAAMRRPGLARWMPGRLRRGVLETRAFLLGSGHRLLVGGPAWARRLEALTVPWPAPELTAAQFAGHVNAFWPQAVWLAKRIARDEARSAVLWHGKLLLEHVYPVLAEEARLEGRTPRPEARKAETWLGPERLRQTETVSGATRAQQARALVAAIDVLVAAATAVAARRGWSRPDHAAVEQWLRAELARLE